MRRVISLILCFSILFLNGCASLNGDVPFRYQPSLLSANQKINKTAALNMLTDMRPQGDKAYTESIKDISEKVTSKLLEDFEKSRIFKDVHFSITTQDDLIINGTINRFMWKLYDTPVSYIPFLCIVVFFGVPCAEAYGIVDITLEIKDSKTGQIIGRFQEYSKQSSSYSIYNLKAGEYGAELSDAFREVVKKLKEDMLTKMNY